MRWWGWLGLGLLLSHLSLSAWRITAWELLGRGVGRGTERTKQGTNWPLLLLSGMLWWSAWR